MQPNGFQMVKIDAPGVMLCDICTGQLDAPHLETFVGGAGQSSMCWACAQDAAKNVNSEKMKHARAARETFEAIA